MATVQEVMLRIIQRVAPATKDGQVIQDDSAAVVITGAANNGAGLIRITAAGHGLLTSQKAFIKGVTGTTEANNTLANPAWTVTRISSSTFDLVGSAFSNTYGADGTVVGALAGSVDPSGITRQRLLDIYNFTRFTLLRMTIKRYPANIVAQVSGFVKRDAAFVFATGVAAKPSALVMPLALEKSDGTIVNIIPVSMRPYAKTLDSATNPIVMDHARSFTAINGVTYVPNGSAYLLEYLGLDTWTLSDVIFFSGTETVETLSEDWLPILVEGCAAFVRGQGVASVEGILAPMIDEVMK